MENREGKLNRFAQAMSCLPPRLQSAALAMESDKKIVCEELRLRGGLPPSAVFGGGEELLGVPAVTGEELREALSRAARYSVHSYAETLKSGFLPLAGGHRLGVCGTAVVQDGHIAGIRTISSLNLRIAGETRGSADGIVPQAMEGGRPRSLLIVSPPGFGKTTLLRDLIRQLSLGGTRVSIADERGELAALAGGLPQFDVGPQTDVLDGCPKAEGVMTLIKTMSPAVVALDEITAPADVEAIGYASHCGVAVLATAHAVDAADLRRRPLYRKLMRYGVFEYLVEITRENGVRQYAVHRIGGESRA